MSRHISGEPDAMRVVSRKPLAQSAACCFGCAGFKTWLAKVAATTCGKWLDRLTSASWISGVNSQHARTNRSPKLLHFFQRGPVGLFRRGYDANGVDEQIRARGADTGFFRAGHRMTADKMRAGFGHQRFEFAHDAGFDAADVGDNGAALQCRKHFPDARTHLRQRQAQNDEVGIPNRRQQIGGGEIHRPRPFTVFQAGATADEARGLAREFPASDGQPD